MRPRRQTSHEDKVAGTLGVPKFPHTQCAGYYARRERTMPRNLAFVGLLLAGVLAALTVSSCGQRARLDAKTLALLEQLRSNQKTPIADALLVQIENAQRDLRIKKGAHIIIGQVVVEGGKDPRMVQPQMHVLEEGYFAGAVAQAGKPVGFRLHGYEPVDIIPMGEAGSIEHIGVVNLKAVPKQDLAGLKGTVEFETREGQRADLKDVRLAIGISTGPVNTPHAPPPLSVELTQNGEFSADGFSPTDYYLHVTAPGCVAQLHGLTFTRGQTLTLEPIRLEFARKISIEYAVSSNGDFAGATPQVTTLVGGDRWKAGDKAEQYAWDLEFQQKAGKLSFAYAYAPCEIADLGKGTFAALRQVDATKLTFRDPQGVAVESGHVYLLNQQHWKHWVLFRVVVEP